MLDGKVIGNTFGRKCGLNDVLGILNLGWEWIEIILSVEVKVYTMISKSLHICLATRGGIALTVWRTHICRILPNDVCKSTFVLAHLISPHTLTDVLQGIVGPSVRCNLMSLGYHSLDDRRIWRGSVDWSFTNVVSCDEESSVKAVLFESIE